MARDFARAFYHSAAWKRTRDAYMRTPVRVLDGRMCPPGMCERCFERGRLVPAEIIHHRTHLNPENISDPEITTSFGNLMRVCRDCHSEIHYPDGYEPRVSFTPDGKVVQLG